MPSHRQNWFEGWRLFAVLTVVLAGLSLILLLALLSYSPTDPAFSVAGGSSANSPASLSARLPPSE